MAELEDFFDLAVARLQWLPEQLPPRSLSPAEYRIPLTGLSGAASCDDDPAVEYPVCPVHQQDWGVPVRITRGGGAARRPLVLAGMDR